MSLISLTPLEREAVRRCTWIAARHIGPGLSREDLAQEGRIAAWRARAALAEMPDDLHRHNSLQRRVLGAMLDANRAAWRQRPLAVFSSDADDPDDDSTNVARASVAPDQPERALQLRQAVMRLVTRGTPQLVECISHLADGADARTVARDLGMHESRVSQLRKRAREIVAACW